MNTAIKTLETLTDTAIDSVRGYELVAERADNPAVKTAFRDRAQNRRETVAKLNDELVRVGGEARTEGTVTGDLHRIWTKLTDRLFDSNKAATDNAEEGEDYIRKKFEAVIDGGLLKDEPKTLMVIENALTEIRAGERITDMFEERYEEAA
ncbi:MULTISPECIES: ferritin-like domain-containing protein [Pacificimonas]|uniref:PA2169 family four-helix-bundle protein n=1 Tax=Pacificimonas aurantium TaxID=1250540 RepID=A0ABS7WKI0_9SPHN|nr:MULTISPECIES: PA2169 family four-helix-bundle protein [Pacificimonas]MBZ6378439.1 PA2169 family four-helix-bundle protein [Pacificimonas aurantium]